MVCLPAIYRRSFVILAFGLYATTLSHAQVPQKGTDATFDVATWNIQTFGGYPGFGPSDEALQFRNVLEVMRRADIDLWAVQEMGPDSCLPSIQDQTCFEILTDSLEGFEGELATELGSEGFVRIGFLYKADVVVARSVAHILVADSVAFSYRPPLLLEADVTVEGSTERIYFVTVHMQARSGATEHARRETAGRVLKEYIDANLAGEKVLVLGDFNDELRQSTRGGSSPYADWVADTTRYSFLTLPVEDRGEPTIFPSGSTFDHLVASRALLASYVDASAASFAELNLVIPSYVSTTSDHLPVLASFDFDRSTDAGTGAPPPGTPTLAQNSPNPFNPSTRIAFELPRPAWVRLSVIDLLGREVAVLVEGQRSAGRHEVDWHGAGLSAGVYLYRLAGDGTVQTRTMTLLR